MQVGKKMSEENHSMQECDMQGENKTPTENYTMQGCDKQGEIDQ